jgi:hypothetical protein
MLPSMWRLLSNFIDMFNWFMTTAVNAVVDCYDNVEHVYAGVIGLQAASWKFGQQLCLTT